MIKNRLVPVLLLRNGVMVQSRGFKRDQRLGDPTTIVERLSSWAADEIIYLDITRGQTYDLGRDDLNTFNRGSLLEILKDVATKCFMPLTFGGGIRSLDDILIRIHSGADKITINTQAIDNPGFVEESAREFGSQCIVVSIDAKRHEDGTWSVMKAGGSEDTGLDPAQWARQMESRGAGEIFLNSVDRDGTGIGLDLALVQSVSKAVRIPVIACGGVGAWTHLKAGLTAGASAVAAANIFNHSENSVFKAKEHLFSAGCCVRPPKLLVQS